MQKYTTTLPNTEVFRTWAKRAIDLLGVPISSLMRDARDSSQNRADVGLNRNKGIKLDFALELEIKLNQIAKDKGVNIGTWLTFPKNEEGRDV